MDEPTQAEPDECRHWCAYINPGAGATGGDSASVPSRSPGGAGHISGSRCHRGGPSCPFPAFGGTSSRRLSHSVTSHVYWSTSTHREPLCRLPCFPSQRGSTRRLTGDYTLALAEQVLAERVLAGRLVFSPPILSSWTEHPRGSPAGASGAIREVHRKGA